MHGDKRILFAVAFLALWCGPRTCQAQLFHRAKVDVEDAAPTLTLGQVAALVDEIDRELFAAGMIDIKAPDVWGQNRMTRYRAEFEQQMAQERGKFQEILQAAQRTADLAVMTSATSLSFSPTGAAAPAAASSGSNPVRGVSSMLSRARGSSNPVVIPPTIVNNMGGLPATIAADLAKLAPSSTGATTAAPAPAPSPAPAGSTAGSDPSSLLDSISKRLDALEKGTLSMPADINQLATKEGKPGVGLEPTIRLDEEARYLNHLHELRRVNAGDDLTDMAGYGLYLLRLPVSLLPGPDSRKGKGAVVTMEARHDLSEDLLENTFRDVVVIDSTYALSRMINDNLHATLCERHLAKSKVDPNHAGCEFDSLWRLLMPRSQTKRDPENWVAGMNDMVAMPQAAKSGSGPNPIMSEDLRIILGPISWPGAIASPNLFGKYPEEIKPPYSTSMPRNMRNIDIKGRLEQALFYYKDRLQLLIASIEQAQADPYHHDPTTLAVIRGSLLETYRYMRENSSTNAMFQPDEVEKIAKLAFRRDLKGLILEREAFLKNLVTSRRGAYDSTWESQVTPTDVLAFVLTLQFAMVDRQLKQDIMIMAKRRGCPLGDPRQLRFYDFEPTDDATRAFNAYVECKWPVRVYSVDPAIEQQNVLDAFSRRSELQLALAVAVASGNVSANNATKYARKLEFDQETVGLNRTAIGFGAGETTFGWRFYPRVQTPPTQSNPRRIADLLYWGGPGPNWDVKNRQIESGPHECIALLVVPNFIPALRLATVANWFDLTGHSARQRIENQRMLELSHRLQIAKNALAGVLDSRLYRPQDLVHITQRIRQLENQLPTQDYRVDLPDEGDLLGSEIFSSNAATLAPTLIAWYGEPVTEGEDSSIFLQGRGFSVFDTQVVAGGVNVPEPQKRLISRNVMQIVVPHSARAFSVCCTTEKEDDEPKSDKKSHSNNSGCARGILDVHIATPNGASNHLFVNVTLKPRRDSHESISTTATTTTTVAGNQTSTTTKLEVTPPGIALPPLTILPLGTPWPANGSLSPGAITGAAPGQIVPGLVPSKPEKEEPTPTLNPPPSAAISQGAPKQADSRTAPNQPAQKATPPAAANPPSRGTTARVRLMDPVAFRAAAPEASPASSRGLAAAAVDLSVNRAEYPRPDRSRPPGSALASPSKATRVPSSIPPPRKAPDATSPRPARTTLLDRLMQRNP